MPDMNKRMDNAAQFLSVALCGLVFASTLFMYPRQTVMDNTMTALAENEKDFKWEKRAISEGTTVDANYLWPDEENASFTAVYRDGEQLPEEKMVTITPGSVYHFRGISDGSILYTQVYAGTVSSLDVTNGETGTWYKLLPAAIRTEFENSGWTWETGWEYTGRAYLDTENHRVMVKTGDNTAVLYGIGLFLDDKYDYSGDGAFREDAATFENVFGETENLFASALEYYYTRGGELRSRCPEIYTMVANAVSQLDTEPTHNNTTSQELPGLMGDLLNYVNNQRTQVGLSTVVWDTADDANAIIRVKEIKELFSQTRPDGTDAFTAYTDAVMCEMRIENVTTAADVYDCASSYFLMPGLTSFTCAVYGDSGALVFVW